MGVHNRKNNSALRNWVPLSSKLFICVFKAFFFLFLSSPYFFFPSSRTCLFLKELLKYESRAFGSVQTWFTYVIEQETERLLADPAPGISATPHEDNLRYFDVIIAGPTQSPFEGN